MYINVNNNLVKCKLTYSVIFKYLVVYTCSWWALAEIKLKEREREKKMFYLTTHSTHFIYGYIASDILLRNQ